ncbi:VWA domain-containing protein [Microbacterium sp. SORGH_AS_0888]|uniref:VWA domain-containing protein n=1 Tax=Microbacterium sp. SORGH_AS_0888 TaxID=3041791 RepID=UPI002789B063|nr:VWA domain-containing protein [Microbacterium sp. SORGH_AS_0888]MDQ1130802.1 hypothetical protein [Microbacterium sp. SORGH_AS_0888]
MGKRGTRGVIAMIGAATIAAGVLGGVAPASVAAGTDTPPPVVFIVDASGSMVRKTPSGQTRMDAAKSAVKTSIAALPSGSQVGLLVFGTGTGNTDAERTSGCSDVKTLAPLGALDAAAMSAQVDSIKESGFTPISTALRQAFGMLPAGQSGNVVLISDGVDTCSPPSSCEVAAQLHAQSPQIAINVVAFGVDDDEEAQQQMTCISGVGGGVASSATDTTQLAAQLRAATSSRNALGTAGMNGIRLGMTLAEVRHLIDGATVSAPTTTDGVEIVYVDCSWGRIELHDGRVYAIAPTETSVATADGIAPGASLSDVEALYGKPVDTGSDSNVYQLARGSRDAYRVYTDSATRTVKRVILCRCAPISAVSTNAADWEITFDGVGPLRLGMTPEAMSAAVPSIIPGSRGQVFTLGDVYSGSFWLTANVENNALVSIAVRDPRATATAVSGLGYPAASGIRLGESMSTVLSAYPGGMFYRNYAGGMSDYVVTDREGHVLSFAASGGTGGSSTDFAGSIRTGRLRSVTLEDASATRAPAPPAAVPSPTAAASLPGLPSDLDGKWCSKAGADCLSFAELAAKRPDAWVASTEKTSYGSTRLSLCLHDDFGDRTCTTASSMYLEYFPAGVAWNCPGQSGFTTCKPDYTSEHDTSRARLVVRLNHQQDSSYTDVEPKYKVG